jgi:hypothetical protein
LNLISRLFSYINLDDGRKSFPETFRRELNYQSSRILTFASVITLSWLTYIPIDMAIHPDKPLLVAFRLAFPVVGLILFCTRFIKPLREKSLLLLIIYGAYLELSTATLTAFTIGDSAYIGGYLFILTLIAVVPYPRKVAYAILYSSVALFFILSWFLGMEFSGARARYSINDIFAVTVTISFFIYILDGTRFMRWVKSREAEVGQRVIEDQKKQLEMQIYIAGELQKALLPRDIPVISEAFIAYNYKPMMEVGGDFVDIFYDDKSRTLSFFICDVSGHGVAGALVSSMVKMTLAGWNETFTVPSKTLFNIHKSLQGKIDSHFVTAGVCSVDLDSGALLYSSAGHPAMIILRSSGDIEFLNSKGRLIADSMPADFENAAAVLEPGDSIVLYTDGVTECLGSDNLILGEAMFLRFLRRNYSLNPLDLSSSIMEELVKIRGNCDFEDDITVLVMCYTGPSADYHF